MSAGGGARPWRPALQRLLRAARAESGQALTEQSLLIGALLFGLVGGGWVLLRTQPELLNALDSLVGSLYFSLSLPFP